MRASTDIDIDFYNRSVALKDIEHYKASMLQNNELREHPSGVYFQEIPIDPKTELASLEYKEAEDVGFFKIDFLNSSMYEGIDSPEYLDMLVSIEPNWSFLSDRTIVEQLPHVSNHYDLMNKYPISSITDLAVFLALIRRKSEWYKNKTWAEIKTHIWDPITEADGYYFKKSHSIAYSVAIGCILVKIEMEKLQQAGN